MIRLILNILWFVFGGWLSGLTWLLAGLILAVTVVGLPWTFAAWRIASYSFWPFGREIVWRDPDPADLGQGCLGLSLNVVWWFWPESGWRSSTCCWPSPRRSPSSASRSPSRISSWPSWRWPRSGERSGVCSVAAHTQPFQPAGQVDGGVVDLKHPPATVADRAG